MFWGKKHNKRKYEKINIIRKKNEKKGKKKKKQKTRKKTSQRENTIAINNIVWGPTMLSPQHLQFILFKK